MSYYNNDLKNPKFEDMTLFNSALNQTTKVSSSVAAAIDSYEIKLPP